MTEKQHSYIGFLANKTGFKGAISAYEEYNGFGTGSRFSFISCREASELIDWLKTNPTPSMEG